MTIREASADDLDAVCEVQREASTAAYAHIYPPDRFPYPEEAIRAETARRLGLPGTIYLVAERNNRVVGVVGTSSGWLEQLYVRPDEQGGGVGTALHDEAVARRRAAGDREVRLWTLEENRSGRAFYEARGWRLAPETRVVPYPPHPTDVSYVLAL